jgi:hypothetical protein
VGGAARDAANGCDAGVKGSTMRRCRHLKENEVMTGIQYVTDEKGRKVAVQIDLKKHRELWEDIQDVLISRSRRNEKRIPLDKVKAGLIKSGKLSRD